MPPWGVAGWPRYGSPAAGGAAGPAAGHCGVAGHWGSPPTGPVGAVGVGDLRPGPCGTGSGEELIASGAVIRHVGCGMTSIGSDGCGELPASSVGAVAGSGSDGRADASSWVSGAVVHVGGEVAGSMEGGGSAPDESPPRCRSKAASSASRLWPGQNRRNNAPVCAAAFPWVSLGTAGGPVSSRPDSAARIEASGSIASSMSGAGSIATVSFRPISSIPGGGSMATVSLRPIGSMSGSTSAPLPIQG